MAGLVGHLVVDVAVAPVLAGLGGGHDGVLRVVEVLGGVFVDGRVAAAAVAAGEAGAEVHPGAMDLEAFFAAVGVGRHRVTVLEVFAEGHGLPFDAIIRCAGDGCVLVKGWL